VLQLVSKLSSVQFNSVQLYCFVRPFNIQFHGVSGHIVINLLQYCKRVVLCFANGQNEVQAYLKQDQWGVVPAHSAQDQSSSNVAYFFQWILAKIKTEYAHKLTEYIQYMFPTVQSVWRNKALYNDKNTRDVADFSRVYILKSGHSWGWVVRGTLLHSCIKMIFTRYMSNNTTSTWTSGEMKVGYLNTVIMLVQAQSAQIIKWLRFRD